MTDDAAVIDFHFDVMCPWAYQASLWIREVRRQLDLTINWRFFSLEEINRAPGKKHPWEREWSYGWSLLRIAAFLRRQDMDLVDDWYALAGRALHERAQKPHRPDVARELLSQIGVGPETFDAALHDESTHTDVRLDHQRVVDAGGFGVPTLFLAGDHCVFGPVITQAPAGNDALRLWELVSGVAVFPNLYDIQRPKSAADNTSIARAFRPYLEARDWLTIDRGRVIDLDSESVES